MAASSNPKRNARLNSNASKTMRTAPKATTKVNSAERAMSVEEFKASRPKEPNRENMIAWAATNPNLKSNAARRLSVASRAAKAAKKQTTPTTQVPKVAKAPKAPKKK
jgi:hypothetical protein